MSETTAEPAPSSEPAAMPAAVAPPSPLLRLVRSVEAALVVGAALFSLVFYASLPSRLPADADYQALAKEISSRARQGDVVLLDPHWAERARLFVTGVTLLNLAKHPTRDDLARYQRVLLLSLPNLPRSDREAALEQLASFRFKRVEGPIELHNLSLTVLENAQVETPSFDFTAHVADARVYIRRPDGSEELCPLQGGRHPCPRAGWINVGAETKEIAFKPYRCVWAHPAGREPLVVEFDGVTLGGELRVMGGIVGQIAFKREHYGVTNFEVKIDGQKAGDIAIPPGLVGEQRRRIDTKKLAGTPHQVRFEVWADNPDMRHFCFDAGVYP